MSPIGPMLSGAPAPSREPDNPARVLDAAQQFEALLLGQLPRAARAGGGGWTGSPDASSDCATEYAEQQLATVMARQGGFGLAALIAQGLERGSK